MSDMPGCWGKVPFSRFATVIGCLMETLKASRFHQSRSLSSPSPLYLFEEHLPSVPPPPTLRSAHLIFGTDVRYVLSIPSSDEDPQRVCRRRLPQQSHPPPHPLRSTGFSPELAPCALGHEQFRRMMNSRKRDEYPPCPVPDLQKLPACLVDRLVQKVCPRCTAKTVKSTT